MVSNVSFGSMFNPERINGGVFNPEHDVECLKNDAEKPKDFPAFPNESVGRSQVKVAAKLPHKLELSSEDKNFLSKLSTNTYGFNENSNEFWVHSRKATQGRIPNLVMGDGKLVGNQTRHNFVKELVNNETQAFQIAGNDKLGGMKLVTVVKNTNSDTVTLYTCDSKQCCPMVLDGDIDIQKLASAITDNLDTIQGVTIWKE